MCATRPLSGRQVRTNSSPKLVSRMLRWISFGEEFVRTCLPLNGRVAHTDGRPRPGL